MRSRFSLPVVLSIASAMATASCSSNNPTDAALDAGTVNSCADTNCPCGPTVPDDQEMTGACCARASNAAKTASPEFRLTGLGISTPVTLASSLIQSLLQQALDEERFNWLIRIEGADTDGTVSATTGYGNRMDASGSGDAGVPSSFSFLSGNAPPPGATDRWDPITVSDAVLSGETITAPARSEAFTVPIIDVDGQTILIELPLRDFALDGMMLSESRTCVGLRSTGTNPSYDLQQGSLSAYITTADAEVRLAVRNPADLSTYILGPTTLCSFIGGITDTAGEAACSTIDRSMWPAANRPDAICAAGGSCSHNTIATTVCDPAVDCNAWRIEAHFSAHGVEIN